MKITVWRETIELDSGNTIEIEYDGGPVIEFDAKVTLDELEELVQYIKDRKND